LPEAADAGSEGYPRLLPSWTGIWAKDSALLLVSQGLSVVATSVAAILIARRLEPADWGVFAAFLGLSFALAIFVEFGLATWLLRELSRLFAENDEAAEHRAMTQVRAAIAFAAAMTGALVVAGTIVGAVVTRDAAVVLALSSLLLYGGLFASANVFEAYLRARRRLRRVVAASIVEKYVLVVLIVAVGVAGWGVWSIGLSYVAAGLIRVALLGSRVLGGTRLARPRFADVRMTLRQSAPFALASGALTVVPRLDALVLLALSATAAGYFALAERILGPAVIVATIGATALYPFLARRAHRPAAIWGLATGFAICGAVLAAAGFVAAPWLVPAVFGEQYESAVTAVRLLLLSLPFVYAANPLLAYGFTSGRERTVVRATMGATLIGTGAIVAGQAIAGVSGAAGGFLIRQVLVLAAFAAIAAAATRRDARLGQLSISPPAEARLG
jgi:O-antigen/teichoic acid export membrane protein